MKLIKSSILDSIITKTTNSMTKKGITVFNHGYYLRMITLYTEINNGSCYTAVRDDYIDIIRGKII